MPQLRFDDVLAYVRSYRNGNDEAAPFDVNGVIHLMLAAVDNLREHMIEGDWEQLANATTEAQRESLIRFATFLKVDGPSAS